MNTQKKYFNDAIISGGNTVASFSSHGELLRLSNPSIDYRQYVDFFHVGIKINDSNIIYLHEDVNNIYSQYYVPKTNVLKTEIFNTYFKVRIIQTDFILSEDDVLARKIKFINENNIDLDISLILHSKLISEANNKVSGYYKDNILYQYAHDYSMATFSNVKVYSHQINNVEADIFSR
jgi:hypothetical protein